MRVIVAGAGEVGFNIARWLAKEGHSVSLIDLDEERLARTAELLDIQTVAGKCSVPEVLARAGAADAEMLVAVTNVDEVNMVACMVAEQQFHIPHKVARIREVGYAAIGDFLSGPATGIDLIIHPEMEAATRLQRLIDLPGATDVLEFGDGTLRLAVCPISEDSPLANQPLKKSFTPSDAHRVLVGAILRKGRVIIPRGADRLQAGDQIFLLGRPDDLRQRLPEIGIAGAAISNVVVVGGGQICLAVARHMEGRNITVKIIEPNDERCAFLSDELRRAIVLRGKITDVDLMREENVGNCDLFLAVSDDEEDNMLACLLAKRMGAAKVICLLNRSEYVPLAPSLGIDAALSPRLSTVGAVQRFLRKGRVLTVDQLVEDQAEIIEAVALQGSDIVGTPLAKIDFPTDAIIGAIIRNGECRIPSGGDMVELDDRVVIIALKKALKKVEKALTLKPTVW
jgi:trk system potassium uptake protein TrkA